MDLKPSELMQIEVSVAYSCIIIKGIFEACINDTFCDPLIIILLCVSKLQVLCKNKQIYVFVAVP